MKNAKNYLFVPIGEGAHLQTLKHLVKLTKPGTCAITLFAVIPRASMWDRALHLDVVEHAQTIQHNEWAATFERWSKNQPVTSTEISVGKEAETIVERSFAKDVDCIVLSAGESHHDRAVIDRVMRTAECPVWLLRPTRAKTTRVLAAVHPEPDELDLNLIIIDRAASLAGETEGQLSIVAAWELYGEDTLRHSSFLRVSERDFHEMLVGREEMTKKSLDDVVVASELSIEHQVKAIHGAPVDVIEQAVKSGRINQLVIGTVGRSGLTGTLLGNTAERVLREVTCSVLVVKQDGFVSPLRLENEGR